MKTLHKKMGRRITMLRYEKDFTQAELAERLDISVKHYSEVERGLAGLSIEKLIMLCDIFSTNLDYLIRGIDNRPEELAGIPYYVIEMFNSKDIKKKELFLKYIDIFCEIRQEYFK